jgi:fucose permease
MKVQINTNNSSKNTKKILAATYYTFFVNGVIALILGAILPYMRDAYHLNYRTAGLLISFHSIGNLISSYVAGVLPMYVGRRKSILLFSSFGVIAFLLMIATSNPITLIILFTLTGLNRGAVSNFNNRAVNEIATGKGKALNVLHSMFAIGAFISPFIALLFTRNNPDGWVYSVAVVSVLCLISFIVYAFIPIPGDNSKNTKQKSEKVETKTDWQFLKNKYFLAACGILFSYMCAEQAVNGLLVTYFIDSGIMSGSLAQTMASLLWLVILFGRLFYAYLSNHIVNSKLLLSGAFGYLIFFIVLLLGRTTISVVIGIIGVGFFMSGIYPTTIASIGKIVKENPMALSVILTTTGLGGIIMTAIIGAVADSIGIIGGMSLVIISVIATFAIIIYNRYIYRNTDET